MQLRYIVDRAIRYLLLFLALVSLLIVFMIFYFTVREAMPAFREIPLNEFFLGDVWRPGQEMYGILGMIAGSILITIGAVIIGVPLAIGGAIFLAEIAPPRVRSLFRPAVELLAGIPSVVYGLVGIMAIVRAVRMIPAPRNSGYGLLSASTVLAIMILPTVTNIAEDAIRAVPRYLKEGSLALGATKWQTIVNVIIPAARSGIVAAIILGIGRALGETMAMIMVIGNSIGMPSPLSDTNPLTIVLSQARTLTGNIAVEINYATGVHRSAIFATGVVLFVMIMLVNSLARALMRGRQK